MGVAGADGLVLEEPPQPDRRQASPSTIAFRMFNLSRGGFARECTAKPPILSGTSGSSPRASRARRRRLTARGTGYL